MVSMEEAYVEKRSTKYKDLTLIVNLSLESLQFEISNANKRASEVINSSAWFMIKVLWIYKLSLPCSETELIIFLFDGM